MRYAVLLLGACAHPTAPVKSPPPVVAAIDAAPLDAFEPPPTWERWDAAWAATTACYLGTSTGTSSATATISDLDPRDALALSATDKMADCAGLDELLAATPDPELAERVALLSRAWRQVGRVDDLGWHARDVELERFANLLRDVEDRSVGNGRAARLGTKRIPLVTYGEPTTLRARFGASSSDLPSDHEVVVSIDGDKYVVASPKDVRRSPTRSLGGTRVTMGKKLMELRIKKRIAKRLPLDTVIVSASGRAIDLVTPKREWIRIAADGTISDPIVIPVMPKPATSCASDVLWIVDGEKAQWFDRKRKKGELPLATANNSGGGLGGVGVACAGKSLIVRTAEGVTRCTPDGCDPPVAASPSIDVASTGIVTAIARGPIVTIAKPGEVPMNVRLALDDKFLALVVWNDVPTLLITDVDGRVRTAR